jgi:ABC-type glycerol-3-phosphate transport system substrate-binding protein
MVKFHVRRRFIAASVALCVAGAAAGVWLGQDQGATHAEGETVIITEGESASKGAPAEALKRLSAHTGVAIQGLEDGRYQLVSAYISDLKSRGGPPTVSLQYVRLGQAWPAGEIGLTVDTGRQPAASGGRENEEEAFPPKPIATSIPGLEIVRTDLDPGNFVYTAWYRGNTYTLVFRPPAPDDAGMLKIIEDMFR